MKLCNPIQVCKFLDVYRFKLETRSPGSLWPVEKEEKCCCGVSESASLTCRDRAVKKKKWKEFAAALEINLQDFETL